MNPSNLHHQNLIMIRRHKYNMIFFTLLANIIQNLQILSKHSINDDSTVKSHTLFSIKLASEYYLNKDLGLPQNLVFNPEVLTTTTLCQICTKHTAIKEHHSNSLTSHRSLAPCCPDSIASTITSTIILLDHHCVHSWVINI